MHTSPPRVPREVLTFGPGRHRFHPTHYPWLRQVYLYAKGGDGGEGPNRESGQPGTGQGVMLPVGWLPDTLRITVEPGGSATGGVGRGQDGFVLVALYDSVPAGRCGCCA